MPVHISHIKCTGRPNHGRSAEVLAVLQQARAYGVRVTADQYAYAASSTGLDVLFPAAELDVGREWALGFFEGVGLREEGWDRWLEEHDWIADIFDLLERLATGEVADPENPGKPATPLPYRERLGS